MIKVGNTRRNPLARAIRNAFSPRDLFGSTTQGAIYDYDDFAYLYQKSDGSVPVTALEQPVGLMLDKRYGGAVGADVRSAGAVALLGSATAATFNTSTGAGSVTRVDASNQSSVRFTLTANTFYRITITNSGSATINLRSGTEAATVWATVAAGATSTLNVLASSAGVISITAASAATITFTVSALVSLPGLHAYQSTDAARPVLSARYNLMTYSQDYSNAAWTKTDVTPTTGQADPIGGTTATLFTEGSTGNAQVVQVATTTAAQSYTITRNVKRGNNDWLAIAALDTVAATNYFRTFVNLATGALGTGQASGNGAFVSHAIRSLGNGWYEVKLTGTLPTATSIASLTRSAASDGGARVNGASYALWGADLRLTADANGRLPAYQSVTTATDYDSAGFKRFDLSDRTDDHFSVASGGGSTTGFLLCAAIQPTGAGTARTIFSDRGTNTGYKVEIDASNNLLFTAGNGAAYTTCTGPTLTAGTPYVITCWHDGTNLNVRVNRGAIASQAFATATAGTTGFTIGRDNGAASGYYSGRRFALTYIKDWTVSLSALESLIVWTASKGAISV